MKWKAMLATAALTAACLPAITFGQNQPGGNGPGNAGAGAGGGGGGNGGGGGGGGRRNFDPAQFQQRMMDNIKTQLNAQDDEWKVIEPKLRKVMDSQRDARAGGNPFGRGGRGGGPGGGGPGGGGPGGGQPPAPTTDAGRASVDLQTTLDNQTATAEDIQKKLTTYRDARDKARADLEAARKDLKEVLTAKQEAQLVLMGMLE